MLRSCACFPDPIFNLAGFFLAVFALQNPVGSFPETLRMLRILKLPVDQYHNRHEEQAPAVKIPDKQHGRKHHKMPPVVDPAVDAALVSHQIRLERAEKQYTDIIAKVIKYREHQKITVSDQILAEQVHAEYGNEYQNAENQLYNIKIQSRGLQYPAGHFPGHMLCLLKYFFLIAFVS